MEPKPLFDVKYWEDAYRFLQKIDEASRLKILENIDKARYALDPKLLKKLTGEIWEFRTKYAGIQYRLLAFWDKRDSVQTLVIATHGFKTVHYTHLRVHETGRKLVCRLLLEKKKQRRIQPEKKNTNYKTKRNQIQQQ